MEDLIPEHNEELGECIQHLDSSKEVLENKIEDPGTLIKEKPILELKPLHPHLKYVFLKGEDEKLAIISSTLHKEEEKRLTKVLKKHKQVLGSKISNLKHRAAIGCTTKTLNSSIKQGKRITKTGKRRNLNRRHRFFGQFLSFPETFLSIS